MTPIIVPVHTHSQKREDPDCPHCHKKLPGWIKPVDTTFKDFLIILGTILFILFQGTMTFGAIMKGTVGSDGPTKECGVFFSQRWHFIAPTYQVSCYAVQWLRNQSDSPKVTSREPIFVESNKLPFLENN